MNKPTAFIHFNEGDPWMRVFFPFDEDVVAVIKEILPKATRWFDRPNGSWMIRPALLRTTVELLEDHYAVHVEAPSGDGPVKGLFARVPPERREKLFQKLAGVLHPDTGGSKELMQDLNEARERWS